MHVLVIGANGQIGQKVVDLLHSSEEHTVKAMVRKEEQAETLADKGVKAVVASLEDSVDEIEKAMSGTDAVIFTAGSGGKTGADKTLLVDLDGAVKSVEAAERNGIERYVMVSAFQANNRENWNDALLPYYAAKHYADKALEASSLSYTIVRPGGLLNENGTGNVAVGEQLERGSVPREDVARVVVEALTNPNLKKRAFDLTSGDTSIKEALQSL